MSTEIGDSTLHHPATDLLLSHGYKIPLVLSACERLISVAHLSSAPQQPAQFLLYSRPEPGELRLLLINPGQQLAQILQPEPCRRLVVIQLVAVLNKVAEAHCPRLRVLKLEGGIEAADSAPELLILGLDDARGQGPAAVAVAEQGDEVGPDRALLADLDLVEADGGGHVGVSDLVVDAPAHIEHLEVEVVAGAAVGLEPGVDVGDEVVALGVRVGLEQHLSDVLGLRGGASDFAGEEVGEAD